MAEYFVQYPGLEEPEETRKKAVNPLDSKFTPFYEKGKAVVGLGTLYQPVARSSKGNTGRDRPGDHLRYNIVADPVRWKEWRTRIIDLAATAVRSGFNESLGAQCRKLLESILLDRDTSGASEAEYADAATDGGYGDFEIARLVVNYFFQIELVAETDGSEGKKLDRAKLERVVAAVAKLAELYQDDSEGFPQELAVTQLKGGMRKQVLRPRVDAFKTQILLDKVPGMTAANAERSLAVQKKAQESTQMASLSPVLRAYGIGSNKHFRDALQFFDKADCFRVLLDGLEKVNFANAADTQKLTALAAALSAANAAADQAATAKDASAAAGAAVTFSSAIDEFAAGYSA